MRILWLLVCTVSAQDLSETRVKVIELEPDLEPVPLATLLANKWLTCDVSDVVDLRAITNTTTDDFDYGSPDGTFEHPPLRRTSRTTWQLMSRALEWEVSLADGTRRHVAGRLPVEGVGSKNDLFYYQDYDKGFFNTVLSAYAHHWGLTTTPEDWWYTIVRKVAMAIDNNAEKETVRDFFVSHEGKKELRVELGNSLYTADYTWFFQQMANQVSLVLMFLDCVSRTCYQGGREHQAEGVCAHNEVGFFNEHTRTWDRHKHCNYELNPGELFYSLSLDFFGCEN